MMPAFLSPFQKAIFDFCRRWQVQELYVFGSILREDFSEKSDIDFLVSFSPTVKWTLFDWGHMEDELQTITGRPVDLVSRKAVETSSNWIRRSNILDTAVPVYAEG